MFNFIIFMVLFAIIFGVTYVSLQRIDFSKMFKANSTNYIKLLILVASISTAYLVARCVDYFINQFYDFFSKAF